MVADRPTAQAVVGHYRQHRVGVASCRILQELSQPAVAAAAASSSDGMRPLAGCLEARPDVAGAAALLQALLPNWWLAPDRQAALAAVRRDRQGGSGTRRRSIVTPQVVFSWRRVSV